MTNEDIRKKLFDAADEKYKSFSAKLVPGENSIIGVRMPAIRKIAKEVSKTNYKEYLKAPFTLYHEECLLYGLVLGYIKTDIQTLLKEMDIWLDCVNNWAVCDSSIMNMKALGKPENSDIVWKYVNEKIRFDKKPFTKRAMIVVLFSYYNNDIYIDRIINIYKSIYDENYYVKMALAWGLSVLATKRFDRVFQLLKNKELDRFIHNKTIQKCMESFRISTEQKQKIKKLKL
ncbi:MAG: DNA alkylation repair protein [Bacillota bacterium]